MPVDADGPPTPKALADELERRDKRATEGPWGVCEIPGGTTSHKWGLGPPVICRGPACATEAQADALLLAYLRNHAAEILAALRENERLTDAAKRVCEHLVSRHLWPTLRYDMANLRLLIAEDADPASHEATKGDEDE